MTAEDDTGGSPLEETLARHRKEKKELQGKVVLLKKTAKSGNKKQQKEANDECAKLEKEMEERHARELQAIPAESSSTETAPVGDDAETEIGADEKSFYKEKKGKSKTQKRQEKKAEENKRRAEAADVDAENAKTSMRTTEMEAINKVLRGRGLKLVDIPPDGDCLFNAIAHQLAKPNLTGEELRRRAAAFIRARSDEFLPFLSTDDGEILDEFHFEQYCVKIETPSATGGHWGGEPELRAISESLERKIEVVQPDSRVVSFGDSFEGRPLIITYHRHAYDLGEHYNSTAALSVPS